MTTQATWTSPVPADVSIYAPGEIDGNGDKLDYADGVGIVISASLGEQSASTDVFLEVEGNVVSVAVTPAMTTSLAVGAKQQLTGTLTHTVSETCDATPNLTWSSSNPSVATVSAGGLVTAVGAGTATISAGLSTVTGTAMVTIP